MGVHVAGSRSMSASTDWRLPGATSSYSRGSALMLPVSESGPAAPLQKFANSRYSGRGCQKDLRVFDRALAADTFPRGERPRESYRVCKSRTALHCRKETLAGVDGGAHLLRDLQWLLRWTRSLVRSEPGNY